MLRAITIVAVVIGLIFVAWSFFVMTGGRDFLVATMTTETPKTPAKETPPAKEAAPAEEPAAEAKENGDAAAPAEEAKDEVAAAEPEASGDDAAEKPEAEAKDEGAEAPADAAAGGVDPAGNPTETAKSAEKGSLTSPYKDNYESVAEEGHKKYMAAGCNGCHGGTGGGGMGPPLSNPVWVYGNDGDTLFRLIALGTNGLQEQGYTRKGSENVVGPMPPHGNIVKSNDDLWKIIAWIWSINPPDKSASAAQ